MSIESINVLLGWMERGWVYESENYLFWDTVKNPIDFSLWNPKPVYFPICIPMMKNENDLVVWSPIIKYGYDSPWNRGIPTANLIPIQEYIQSIDSR